jgi:ATP-dependent Clp protease ATP-binding subunit ClpC
LPLPPLPQNAVLARWIEKDLTASTLAPAYEIEDLVHRATGILQAGRGIMLLGPPGVGKTALLHELVRRAVRGDNIPALSGRRVVQISIKRCLSGFKKPAEEIGPAFQELVIALVATKGTVIPFFRDAHLAYRFDLESQFASLANQLPVPVIVEGEDRIMRSIVEYESSLAESFVQLPIEEPNYDVVRRIIDKWGQAHPRAFDDNALETSMALCHRFLARGCFPRKVIQFLDNTAATVPENEVVDESGVLDHFCRTHRVPRHLVDPQIPLDLSATDRTFREQVLGQGDAVSAVIQMIALIKAGLSDVRRPFGVFMFVGPTGVGKTHLAQLLAEYLFGSRERLIRINMADYQTVADAPTLFGNPEHHNPVARRGVLTSRVAGHPFAVLLFDELEKAHKIVIDRFLQLMDEGQFINGAGETVSCRSTIVIATSNAGAAAYGGRMVGFSGAEAPAELRRRIDVTLEDTFRIEFLNRFDHVVHFKPLERSHIRDIARRELGLLRKRQGLTRLGLHLEVDESVLDWLTAHGYDPRHGARFLRRAMERSATTAVAQCLVRQMPKRGSSIRLKVRGGSIVAIAEPLEPPRAERQELHLPQDPTAHTLSPERLITEARQIVERSTPLMTALESDTTERSRLLEQLNEPTFWKRGDRGTVMERYRDLDVRVQGAIRSARAVQNLQHALSETSPDLRSLARQVEHTAQAIAEWLVRQASSSANHVWLVLTRADTLDNPDGAFIQDLLGIQEAWCKRSGLDVERVAIHEVRGSIRRIVLEVQGPAAEAMLAAEVGLHRLHRADGPDQRVLVAVLPRVEAEPPDVQLRKRRPAPLDMVTRCEGRLELPQQGIQERLMGTDATVLAEALASMHAHPELLSASDLVRHYAVDGVGARDPRTGVTVKRFKDLRMGRLDSFLDALRGLTSA